MTQLSAHGARKNRRYGYFAQQTTYERLVLMARGEDLLVNGRTYKPAYLADIVQSLLHHDRNFTESEVEQLISLKHAFLGVCAPAYYQGRNHSQQQLAGIRVALHATGAQPDWGHETQAYQWCGYEHSCVFSSEHAAQQWFIAGWMEVWYAFVGECITDERAEPPHPYQGPVSFHRYVGVVEEEG